MWQRSYGSRHPQSPRRVKIKLIGWGCHGICKIKSSQEPHCRKFTSAMFKVLNEPDSPVVAIRSCDAALPMHMRKLAHLWLPLQHMAAPLQWQIWSRLWNIEQINSPRFNYSGGRLSNICNDMETNGADEGGRRVSDEAHAQWNAPTSLLLLSHWGLKSFYANCADSNKLLWHKFLKTDKTSPQTWIISNISCPVVYSSSHTHTINPSVGGLISSMFPEIFWFLILKIKQQNLLSRIHMLHTRTNKALQLLSGCQFYNYVSSLSVWLPKQQFQGSRMQITRRVSGGTAVFVFLWVTEGDNQMPAELWKWLSWSTMWEREQSKKHDTYHPCTSTPTQNKQWGTNWDFWIQGCNLGSNSDSLSVSCTLTPNIITTRQGLRISSNVRSTLNGTPVFPPSYLPPHPFLSDSRRAFFPDSSCLFLRSATFFILVLFLSVTSCFLPLTHADLTWSMHNCKPVCRSECVHRCVCPIMSLHLNVCLQLHCPLFHGVCLCTCGTDHSETPTYHVKGHALDIFPLFFPAPPC